MPMGRALVWSRDRGFARVTTALLADAAAVSEGKLDIHGGGWDVIVGASLPLTQPSFSLAWTLRVEYDEALRDIPVVLDLLTEDDEEAGVHIGGQHQRRASTQIPPRKPDVHAPGLTLTMFPFSRAGGSRFRIASGDSELASVPFTVLIQPNPGGHES